MDLTKAIGEAELRSAENALIAKIGRSQNQFWLLVAVFFVVTMGVSFSQINIAGALAHFFAEAPKADAGAFIAYLLWVLTKAVFIVAAALGFSYGCAKLIFAISDASAIFAFSNAIKLAKTQPGNTPLLERIVTLYVEYTGFNSYAPEYNGGPDGHTLKLKFASNNDDDRASWQAVRSSSVIYGQHLQVWGDFGMTFVLTVLSAFALNVYLSGQYVASRAILISVFAGIYAGCLFWKTAQAGNVLEEIHTILNSLCKVGYGDNYTAFSDMRSKLHRAQQVSSQSTVFKETTLQKYYRTVRDIMPIVGGIPLFIVLVTYFANGVGATYKVASVDEKIIIERSLQNYAGLNAGVSAMTIDDFVINPKTSFVDYVPSNSDLNRLIGVFRNKHCEADEVALKLPFSSPKAEKIGGIYFCASPQVPTDLRTNVFSAMTAMGAKLPRQDR